MTNRAVIHIATKKEQAPALVFASSREKIGTAVLAGEEGGRAGRSPPWDPMMPSRPWRVLEGRDRHDPSRWGFDAGMLPSMREQGR